MPRGAVDLDVSHGQVVFYRSPIEEGGAFDVLLDGVICGTLLRRLDEVSGKAAWCIGNATGALAGLTHRRWNDYSADSSNGPEWWLETVVLVDIRAVLTRQR